MAGRIGDANAPRVEGVNLVAYVGKSLDLNRVATRVGSYQAGMGSSTHEVFDVPASALHPFVRDRLPDTIASSPDGSIIRLYVPVSNRGQITDIGILNAVYKAPAHPFVSRSGHQRMYCAPADLDKYKALCEPARQKGELKSWGEQGWQPGPGDRFRVTEIS